MGRVEEIRQEETDELEGHGDHGVPYEAEEGSDRHAVDVDLVGAAETWREDRRLPVRRCSIRGGLLVCLFKETLVSQEQGGR